MPDEAEALGLLALMMLIQGRRRARTGPGGELMTIADQDRRLWDTPLLEQVQNVSGDACDEISLGDTKFKRRSKRFIATLQAPRRPTGFRCWPYTTSCSPTIRARSSRLATAPSQSPRTWPRSRVRLFEPLRLDNYHLLPRDSRRLLETAESKRGSGVGASARDRTERQRGRARISRRSSTIWGSTTEAPVPPTTRGMTSRRWTGGTPLYPSVSSVYESTPSGRPPIRPCARASRHRRAD